MRERPSCGDRLVIWSLCQKDLTVANMRKLLWILATFLPLLASLLTWANFPPPRLPADAKADRVIVRKSLHTLELVRRGEILARYSISLGPAPTGRKEREGDGRSPEGTYALDSRNPASAFHLALHVSYPNDTDRHRAAEKLWNPGGMIMVHGLPNRLPFLGRLHRLLDWTNGCIAVTNAEIEQIWKAVDNGTPIEIRP